MSPRFFARLGDRGQLFGAQPLAHVVAALQLEGREWPIAVDREGLLYRARAETQLLGPVLQKELADHALVGRRWGLKVPEIHLMALEKLSAGPNIQGLNDPLHLEGVLSGPYPSPAPEAFEGRLAITRADFLAAVVRAPALAFQCASDPSQIGPARWHGLLLPGASADELQRGEGLILAIPISRAELELGQLGNEGLVTEFLEQVLNGLLADARRGDPSGPLAQLKIREKKWFGKSEPVTLESLIALAGEALGHLADIQARARNFALEAKIQLGEAWWSAEDGWGLVPEEKKLQLKDGFLVGRKGHIQFGVPHFLPSTHLEVVVECQCEGPLNLNSGPISLGVEPQGRPWQTAVFQVRGTLQQGLYFSAKELKIRRVNIRAVLAPPRVEPARAESRPPVQNRPPPNPPQVAPPPPRPPQPAPAPRPVVAAPPRTKRVVFYDPRYPSAWVRSPERVALGLKKSDYAVMDATGLLAWLESCWSQGAGGALLVIMGSAPDILLDGRPKTCKARRYLEAGGRIAWIGEVPFHYRGLPNGDHDPDWKPAQGQILELGPPGPSLKNPEITPEGRAWGLNSPDLAVRTQTRAEVSVTLSAAGDYAASWFQRFKTHPGAGFLRFRAGIFPGDNDALVAELARVAGHGLTT